MTFDYVIARLAKLAGGVCPRPTLKLNRVEVNSSTLSFYYSVITSTAAAAPPSLSSRTVRQGELGRTR